MEGCGPEGEGEEGGSPAPPPFRMLLETLTKLRFVLDEDSYLVPELDGVRIFSRSTHEFLHEVPGEALTRAPGDPGQDQGIEAVLRIPCPTNPVSLP